MEAAKPSEAAPLGVAWAELMRAWRHVPDTPDTEAAPQTQQGGRTYARQHNKGAFAIFSRAVVAHEEARAAFSMCTAVVRHATLDHRSLVHAGRRMVGTVPTKTPGKTAETNEAEVEAATEGVGKKCTRREAPQRRA